MPNITTGKVRFSYLYIFEPRNTEAGDSKYTATLILPKSDIVTKQKIDAEIQRVLQEASAKTFKGNPPANPKITIYDGDGIRPSGELFSEECHGCWVINTSASRKEDFIIVDANGQDIFDRNEVYSGCYGRASIRFFAYNNNGNKGIGCALCGIQKLEDGEPLAGRNTAREDFAALSVPAPEQPQYSMPQQPQYNAPQPQAPQYNTPQTTQVPYGAYTQPQAAGPIWGI